MNQKYELEKMAQINKLFRTYEWSKANGFHTFQNSEVSVQFRQAYDTLREQEKMLDYHGETEYPQGMETVGKNFYILQYSAKRCLWRREVPLRFWKNSTRKRLYPLFVKQSDEILKKKVEVNKQSESGGDADNQDNADTHKTDDVATEFSQPLPGPALSETPQNPEDQEWKPSPEKLKLKQRDEIMSRLTAKELYCY